MSILDKVVRTEDRSLLCTHGEADSCILGNVLSLENQSNVVIRTADTDYLIIGLECREKLDPSLKIWLEVRVQSRNNFKFISVDSIYSNLEKNICKALPAYHTFTGSDFTAFLSRKGKIQPLKKLEKDVQAQIVFGYLGRLDDGQSNDFTEIDQFTCKLYDKKSLKKIDDVRTDIFMEKYKPKTDRDKISCAKKLDASMMPPCELVLLNKIRRTKFVAKLWMSSIKLSRSNNSPLNFGWKLVDRNY